MRKVLSILLVMVLCLAMAVTALATDDFVSSPGEGGTPCDHDLSSLSGKKDPNCTANGYTGDLVCDECGEIIEEGKVIPAKGHTFKDGVCTECGAPEVPKTGDNSGIVMWTTLMAVSAVAVVAAVGFSRKRV